MPCEGVVALSTMRQAVLSGGQRFTIEDAGTPAPGPNDVLVKVQACGVCASELHAWEGGEGAPRMLGHEVAGEVVAVGTAASGLVVGDRVTGLFQRGFADYAMAPADRVARLPDGIGAVHAFGEPLACVISAARRTRVDLGDRVIVVGLGFMGLLMLQLVRSMGAAHIIGVDVRGDALAAARRLGADEAVTPEALDRGLLASFAIEGSLARGGVDVVVEATGTQAGLTLAGELVRQHGILSILGYHQGAPRSVDMRLWNFKAFDVVNAHERRTDYRMDCMRRGLALAAGGRLDLASLVTHTFALDDVGRAFQALATKPPGFIKSVVVANQAVP